MSSARWLFARCSGSRSASIIAGTKPMRLGYRPAAGSHVTGMSLAHGEVLIVRPSRRAQDDGAVLRVAAHRPDLVERRARSHHAVAAHAAERRAQADETAADRRRQDRSAGVGSDREADEARGGRGAWTRRRSARSFRRVPRIVRASAGPLIAERELAGRELRDEHGAGRVQPRDDRGVLIERLRRERRRAPARRRALRRDDVLDAVRNAVQRTEVAAGAQPPVRLGGFRHRTLFGQRGHAIQHAVVTLQSGQVHRRQFLRRHLPGAQQLREMRDGPERGVFEIRGPLHLRRGLDPEDRRGAFGGATPGGFGLK